MRQWVLVHRSSCNTAADWFFFNVPSNRLSITRTVFTKIDNTSKIKTWYNQTGILAFGLLCLTFFLQLYKPILGIAVPYGLFHWGKMFQTKISIYIHCCCIRIIKPFQTIFLPLIRGRIACFKMYFSCSHASVSKVEVPKTSQDLGIPFIFRRKQEALKRCTQIIILCVHCVAFGNYSGLKLLGFLYTIYTIGKSHQRMCMPLSQ